MNNPLNTIMGLGGDFTIYVNPTYYDNTNGSETSKIGKRDKRNKTKSKMSKNSKKKNRR